ncbi:MAG TPA: class I SAM-dependent methyltransferase [Actinokineospora sp.]|jgi:predicted O-methyltransferase YrrM|nr:class I SAM-dependent methyltransferase [Actinokineospora sp.]
MADVQIRRDGVSFERAWEAADAVPGWMTRAQGRALWDAVQRLGAGQTVVEIGSHKGRSTVILGHAARTVGAKVVAIDPFLEGPPYGGQPTRDAFERNIAAEGLGDVVELVIGYSTELRKTWERPVDLLYIDGKHDYWTYTDDLRWSAFMPEGAEILVHDCFTSVGVTSGTLAKVLASGRLAYVERETSLARFVLRPPAGRDRLRLLAQLPWFARNVVVKGALKVGLRPLAKALGHHSPVGPY